MGKRKPKPINTNGFKIIKRKIQKRKDGKRVYSYYNDTDKKKASREDWAHNENIKANFKRIYGAGKWQDKFKEGVKDVKQEEKKQYIHENTKLANEIEEYRIKNDFAKADGSPKRNDENFFNQSICTELELHTLGSYSGNYLIKSGDKYYLPTEKNLLEFRYYVNDLAEFFFDYIKDNLPKKTLKQFSEGSVSPAIMFNKYRFINEDYPDLFIFDLDKTIITDDVPYMEAEFKKQKKKLEKIYFANFKTVNIYNYIQKNGKVKTEKPKRRKTRKRKK